MGSEKFNWKSLFITDENKSEEEERPTEEVQQTTTTSKFPEKTILNTEINNTILHSIVEMYESGFESLNQPGYDFYEFFKAINAVGSHDPAIYKMAFTMAKSVDSAVSKESLLKQSDFYMDEINKVHKQYEIQGIWKRAKIVSDQKMTKDNIVNEISSLESQLLEIQTKLSQKKNALQAMEGGSMPELNEIDQKIEQYFYENNYLFYNYDFVLNAYYDHSIPIYKEIQ